MAKRRVYLNKQNPFVDVERKLTKVTQKAWDDVEEQATALVDLDADVTGILPAGNGGTGRATLTDHAVLLGSGSAAVDFAAPGAAGTVLTSNGASADPTFQAAAGDVAGPASATDEALVRFNGTTGKLIQNSTITLSDGGALTFPDNVRQTFNPGATNAGLNVGSHAGDPSGPSNGDLWYDSVANELTARINGANVALSGAAAAITETIGITVDGAGSAISTGTKGAYRLPYAGTITRWTLLADQSGDVEFDIFLDPFASYPPTTSIVASAPPELTAADSATSTTLTGWTTSVSVGDVFGYEVVSAATLTRVTLQLDITRA